MHDFLARDIVRLITAVLWCVAHVGGIGVIIDIPPWKNPSPCRLHAQHRLWLPLWSTLTRRTIPSVLPRLDHVQQWRGGKHVPQSNKSAVPITWKDGEHYSVKGRKQRKDGNRRANQANSGQCETNTQRDRNWASAAAHVHQTPIWLIALLYPSSVCVALHTVYIYALFVYHEKMATEHILI